LSAGQAADAPMADKLLNDIQPGSRLLADKAYDTDAIRNFAKQRKCWANIPAKANRKQTFSFSRSVYRQRNLVERSSIASNRCVVWQRDMTDMQLITLPGSNLPQRRSGSR
jgi:transposase